MNHDLLLFPDTELSILFTVCLSEIKILSMKCCRMRERENLDELNSKNVLASSLSTFDSLY